MSEPRRTLPRLFSMLLVSAAVAVISVPAARSTASAPSQNAGARVPTDIYRGQQWTLDALHLTRAWHYSRGNGVTVAVLDTGVDGHQSDLVGRVIDGPDLTGHARRPGSRYWGRHGTQMASIIAGHGHGPGGSEGIMGVAPDARILSIRVTWELGDPMRTDRAELDGSRDAIAEGIRYATDHGAQVISMSLGGGKLFYDGNPLEESAINYALGKGVVLVASAGNDGGGPNRRNYPAAYPGVIAVGAVDRAFKPAKFTNRHTYVSVAAPGVEIVSADVSGQGYVLGTGTSPSAAFVAGISALVKSRYPRLTPAEVKDAIEEGVTHRPPDGRDDSVGTGVADALGAIHAAARINKAEHGGAAVRQPSPSATATPRPASAMHSGVDLMLVAVLSGGGTLMVLSLILGWRQRRRRLAAERAAYGDDDDDDYAAPVPAGVSARRSPPGASRAAGPSPWEPRPPGSSPWEPRSSGRSPWEPGPGGEWRSPEISPWERSPSGEQRPSGGQRPSGTTPWEPLGDDPVSPRSASPAPASSDSVPPGGSSWPADSASSWRSRLSETSSWEKPETSSRQGRSAATGPPGSEQAGPSSWADEPAEASSWDDARSETSSGGAGRTEASSSRAPHGADGSVGTGGGERSGADATPFGLPSSLGLPPGHRSAAQGPEAYGSPDPAQPAERTGRTTGGFPAVTQEFRAADAPDPLSDGPIESYDVGTPLAEQSWESIRRGFDRLKEDTRNWDSAYRGIGAGLDLPAGGSAPADDASGTTPDDDRT